MFLAHHLGLMIVSMVSNFMAVCNSDNALYKVIWFKACVAEEKAEKIEDVKCGIGFLNYVVLYF